MKILIKIYNWIIKMAKKVLNLDTETGVESWQDASGGLPSGTVNQTLRHNETDWVADSSLIIVNDTTNNLNYVNITLDSKSAPQAFNITQSNAQRSNAIFRNTNGTYNSGAWGLQFLMKNQNGISITLGEGLGTPEVNDSVLHIKCRSKLIGITDVFTVDKWGKIRSNYLSGTGTRSLVALADGTIAVGTTITPNTPLEYLSANLSGTEHTFTGTTIGITGDLRTRIKFIDVYAVDGDGNWNSDLIDSKFVYENDITINSTVSLGGSFKIRLYIEYV